MRWRWLCGVSVHAGMGGLFVAFRRLFSESERGKSLRLFMLIDVRNK